MKYFTKAVKSLPVGSKLFVARRRIIKIVIEVDPDVDIYNRDQVDDRFRLICQLYNCSFYLTSIDNVEGAMVRKEFEASQGTIAASGKESN